VSERDDRLAVDADLLGVAARIVFHERPRGPEAGVVDEQLDVEAELRDAPGKGCRVPGEIAGDDVRLGRKLAGQLLEALGSAGDQDQVVAAR